MAVEQAKGNEELACFWDRRTGRPNCSCTFKAFLSNLYYV